MKRIKLNQPFISYLAHLSCKHSKLFSAPVFSLRCLQTLPNKTYMYFSNYRYTEDGLEVSVNRDLICKKEIIPRRTWKSQQKMERIIVGPQMPKEKKSPVSGFCYTYHHKRKFCQYSKISRIVRYGNKLRNRMIQSGSICMANWIMPFPCSNHLCLFGNKCKGSTMIIVQPLNAVEFYEAWIWLRKCKAFPNSEQFITDVFPSLF